MSEGYNRNIFTKGTATYTDIDMSFQTHPLTGDIRKKTDLDSIKQSLKNLLFTNYGERPFRPLLAGNLNDLLFEPLDDIIIEELKKSITTTVNNYEPRIDIISLEITPKGSDNELGVTLTFNMINYTEPQIINTIIKRQR